MNLATDKCWLVKVNGEIRGPLTQAEIFEMLKSKEIVVLNEVMQPFRRWRYIRDLDAFNDIVEELRVMEFGGHEDMTMTATQTASVTEKLSDGSVFDRTLEININHPDEIVIEEIDEVSTQSNPYPKLRKAQYQANISQKQLHQQTAKTTKSIWMISLLVVLSVTGFVFYKRTMKPQSKEKNYSAEEYTKMALSHYYAGDYKLALPLLHKARDLRPSDKKINSLLAPLMVYLEPSDKKKIDDVLEVAKTSPDMTQERMLTLQGLLELKERNYRSAKRILNNALRKNPFFWQAFANLGVISFLEGDYLAAKNHFESALSIEVPNRTSRGEVYLMRAASEIYLWKQYNIQDYLKNAQTGLESYISEYSDYKQEAYLLKGFVDYALNNKLEAKKTVADMVNIDPKLTVEHAKDPIVDRSPISWKQLLPWCEALVEGVGQSGQVSAMYSLCLLNNGESEIDAKVEISKAMSQSPKDPLVNAVFAYVTWILGEDSKAEMLATQAVDNNRGELITLPHIIKARICEKSENWDCAIENWLAVKALDETAVSAYGGLAMSYLKKKKFNLFESVFSQGTKYSRYYKPLLRSEVLAEEEGLNVRRD